MKPAGKLLMFSIVVAYFISCQKPFNPDVTTSGVNYLVVEGVINSGQDTTHIKLSRSAKLESKSFEPEGGARVKVEGDDDSSYQLIEDLKGTYSAINLSLPADHKYRLHIVTADGREYLSEFVENKITPPIDSITFKPLTNGVQFYANAHDANNKTRYYRWDYDESWTYEAAYRSNLKYEGGEVRFRTKDELTFTCYRHARPSNSVFIGSSAKLATDFISQSPIGFVDAGTGKFFHIYSIEVAQYALTSEAYTYWELIKKNTEQLGSIFDASPSSTLTNIHAINNKELVIGYVSVSTITKKRIFIEGRNLPFPVSVTENADFKCKKDTILYDPLSSYKDREESKFARGDSIPTDVYARKPDGLRLGFFYAPKICVDCRLQGGTNIKPFYWP